MQQLLLLLLLMIIIIYIIMIIVYAGQMIIYDNSSWFSTVLTYTGSIWPATRLAALNTSCHTCVQYPSLPLSLCLSLSLYIYIYTHNTSIRQCSRKHSVTTKNTTTMCVPGLFFPRSRTNFRSCSLQGLRVICSAKTARNLKTTPKGKHI